MAAEDIGIQLVAEGLAAFQSSLARAQRSVDQFAGRLDAAEASSGAVGTSGQMAFGLVQTAAFLAADAIEFVIDKMRELAGRTIETAADYQDQMAIMEIVSQGSGATMEELSEFAQDMGTTTLYSAEVAADAMNTLFKAGLDAQEVYETLPAAIDLATASDLNLEQAAYALIQMTRTFGRETGDATDIVDHLVRSANASVLEVEELTQAMVNAGPTVSMFGMDLETANTALAILSDRGIRGSAAGTMMGRMLLNMHRVTPKVTEAWEEMGVALYDADGAMRAFPDVMADLSTAMEETGDMTEQARTEFMQTVGGFYGVRGMQVFLEEGTEGWEGMQEKIADTAGASEMAEARLDTLHGRTKILQSSIETLMIQGATPLIEEFLQPLVEELTGQAIPALREFIRMLFGGKGLMVALEALIPEDFAESGLGKYILGIAGGLDELGRVLGEMDAEQIRNLGEALAILFVLFNLKTAVALGVIAFAISGIAEAAAPFAEFLESVGGIVSDIVEGDWEGAFWGLGDAATHLFDSIASFFVGGAQGVSDLLGIDVDIAGGLAAWGGVFNNFCDLIVAGLHRLFDPAEEGGLIATALAGFKDQWDTFWGTTIPSAFEDFRTTLERAWDDLWKWQEGGVIHDAIMAALAGIEGFFGELSRLWHEFLVSIGLEAGPMPTVAFSAIPADIQAPEGRLLTFQEAYALGTQWAGIQRQFGGPVWPGQSYIVGEERPEIFTPQVSGMIVPAPVVSVAGGSTATDNRTYNYNMRYNERARSPLNDLRMLQAAGLT